MNGYRNASFAGIVLYIIGVVLFVYGYKNLEIEKDLDLKGIKTKGTVVDLAVTEPYRQAYVEFKTPEGQSITFLDKLFWYHGYMKYTVKMEVEVIYDPANPNGTATINEFYQRNIAPYGPMAIGTLVIFVGWIMRIILLKKAKKLDEQLKKPRN